MMLDKLADPLLQLDVDEWILDYLAFCATKALLHAFRSSKDKPCAVSDECEQASLCLQLVDSFFTTFCAMHPGYDANLDLRFRLRLLQFTVIFTKRSLPEDPTLSGPILQDLRHRRQEHAFAFSSNNNELASRLPNLTKHLAPLANGETKKDKVGHVLTAGNRELNKQDLLQPAVSLLDTIPPFMALSAAQISMQGGTITDTWMRLAAGYMAQAVAEQYLIYGSQRRETLQEAFSWGFNPECNAEEGTDDFQINAMFWGMDAIIDGWEKIRDEHANALIPPAGADLKVHLEVLMANGLCISQFERRLIDFLDKMMMGQSKPFLVQIELGRIDGLTRKDVKELLDAIGMV